MYFSTESKNLHPQARLIPYVIWSEMFKSDSSIPDLISPG